jgi:hypothetical protein
MACQQDEAELADHWNLSDPVSYLGITTTFCLFFLTMCRSYVGTIVLMTVPNNSTATKAGLLFSYYIVLSFWAAQGLGMSLLSR